MHTELQRSRRLPLLSDRSDELVWGHIGGVNIPPSDSTAWYEPSLVTTDTEWGPDEHTHTHHTHTHTPHTHTHTHTQHTHTHHTHTQTHTHTTHTHTHSTF